MSEPLYLRNGFYPHQTQQPKLREFIWWFEAEGDLDVEPEGEYAR